MDATKYKPAELITRPFAHDLVVQSGLLAAAARADAELVVFDNACGTGVVAQALFDALPAPPAGLQVLCGDLSPGMVAAASQRIEEGGWARARAQDLDAQVACAPCHSDAAS
jgi:ubiquinone/menaquinone biosynthesis C-methylase UbiE